MNKTHLLLFTLLASVCLSEVSGETKIVSIGTGWARNSVNAVILRHNSVVSHQDNQYVAYYDADGFVVLAKRKVGSEKWESKKTQYKGNVKDAHNSISIMVTYPEFYRLPDGNLLFLYRDGASGRGNLMMNHYDLTTKKWTQRQDAFINGEGRRNAYWQMCTDTKGTIHISWVWRSCDEACWRWPGFELRR